jgi:hypothetical protein
MVARRFQETLNEEQIDGRWMCLWTCAGLLEASTAVCEAALRQNAFELPHCIRDTK